MNSLIFFNKTEYTDSGVVEGLQEGSRKVEEWFYDHAKRYFYAHFNEVFFDKDRKQEVFQTAFLKLWTEIANRKIRVREGQICRQRTSGDYAPMTCSLTTFLMTFAKNENREIMRSVKDIYVENILDVQAGANGGMAAVFQNDEDIREQKARIIDDCILSLPPHCVEIVTLYYYKGKSLDEILALRKDKSSTKNGLKSAKTKCMATLKERVSKEMKRQLICQ